MWEEVAGQKYLGLQYTVFPNYKFVIFKVVFRLVRVNGFENILKVLNRVNNDIDTIGLHITRCHACFEKCWAN